MNEELRPCPFCGRQPYESGGYVSCHTELCLANADYHEPAIGSITDWNTRPIEDALNRRIAELEAAQRWIPVSERLPEEDTDGNTLMAICRHSGEWVIAPFGAEFADEFVRHYTHWMYAPQPPEVQE